jgi:hypothetical protein
MFICPPTSKIFLICFYPGSIYFRSDQHRSLWSNLPSLYTAINRLYVDCISGRRCANSGRHNARPDQMNWMSWNGSYTGTPKPRK